MSGWNSQTGTFELTATKTNNWLRRENMPQEVIDEDRSGMYMISDLFVYFGYEVTKIGGNYLHVKANPDQVWEVLSGQPSNPERSAHHYRHGNVSP